MNGYLPLQALEGTNPLGFLAALGVLGALADAGCDATLQWDDDVVPCAVLGGVRDLAEALDVLDADRQRWAGSTALNYPPRAPLRDAKPSARQLREWYEALAGPDILDADADLLCAIAAEGAFDRNGNAKPTHLHFTAGQQQFLDMVRTLAASLTREHLAEAVDGPWSYKSPLPSLSWDVRTERVYAMRATNPSGEKRLGVPGADWLAFRGLAFYPVSLIRGSLQTTACDRAWKNSAFRWPLWSVPATRDVVRSLVADGTLVSQDARPRPGDLAARGIVRVLQSPIRRSDQGGYGTFGGPVTLAAAMPGGGR